ncbi:MAG: chromate transporter [Kiritimatiellae bacterium]|nr:chromate transporter [Kiritimatiellia bacterium]
MSEKKSEALPSSVAAEQATENLTAQDCGLVDIKSIPLSKRLMKLFFLFMKIALCVVGGGYAIIAAAEEVFEQKLKWLPKGDLINHLPVFQTIPGLIAGNSAMYVGYKIAGFLGAVVSLIAVALPSFVIISFVAVGFSWLPTDNPNVQGAFIGVRSALAGVVAATVIKSWPKIMHGCWAWLYMPISLIGIMFLKINAAYFLLGGILFGVVFMLIMVPIYNRLFKKEKEAK